MQYRDTHIYAVWGFSDHTHTHAHIYSYVAILWKNIISSDSVVVVNFTFLKCNC